MDKNKWIYLGIFLVVVVVGYRVFNQPKVDVNQDTTQTAGGFGYGNKWCVEFIPGQSLVAGCFQDGTVR